MMILLIIIILYSRRFKKKGISFIYKKGRDRSYFLVLKEAAAASAAAASLIMSAGYLAAFRFLQYRMTIRLRTSMLNRSIRSVSSPVFALDTLDALDTVLRPLSFTIGEVVVFPLPVRSSVSP